MATLKIITDKQLFIITGLNNAIKLINRLTANGYKIIKVIKL